MSTILKETKSVILSLIYPHVSLTTTSVILQTFHPVFHVSEKNLQVRIFSWLSMSICSYHIHIHVFAGREAHVVYEPLIKKIFSVSSWECVFIFFLSTALHRKIPWYVRQFKENNCITMRQLSDKTCFQLKHFLFFPTLHLRVVTICKEFTQFRLMRLFTLMMLSKAIYCSGDTSKILEEANPVINDVMSYL